MREILTQRLFSRIGVAFSALALSMAACSAEAESSRNQPSLAFTEAVSVLVSPITASVGKGGIDLTLKHGGGLVGLEIITSDDGPVIITDLKPIADEELAVAYLGYSDRSFGGRVGNGYLDDDGTQLVTLSRSGMLPIIVRPDPPFTSLTFLLSLRRPADMGILLSKCVLRMWGVEAVVNGKPQRVKFSGGDTLASMHVNGDPHAPNCPAGGPSLNE